MSQVPSSLPPSVPTSGGVPAVAMPTNPQATTKGTIMFLTNFVFISVISFHCFGLLWLLVVRSHFWPFTEVQNGNRREVTRKVGRRRNFEAYAVASNSRMARRVPCVSFQLR